MYIMKKLLTVIVITAVIFCFAACDSPITSPLEYGNVRIAFVNDAGRTIYPSKIFDNYVYTFTKQGGTPQILNPSNGMFALEIGNWNVRVDAYIGTIIPQNMAASGMTDFTLDADEGKVVSISLQAEETTGYGTFEYHIQYPAGTTIESFTLTKLPEMITMDIYHVIGATAITGAEDSIPAGMYQLDVRFAKGGLYAGTNEIVHIYALLTTEYGTTQSPIVFEEKDFSNPIPITSAEIIVVAPVKSAVPGITASGTGYFSIGAVSWDPEGNLFLGNTVYTVTVMLTADNGYTFSTLSSATINGQDATVSSNTGATVMLSYTFPATNTRTTTDIQIKTQPDKLIYTHGDQLDLAGLVVTLTYDDTTVEDVPAAGFITKSLTANPAHGNHLIHLTHNGLPIAITYGELTPLATNALTVNPKVITFTVDPIPAQTFTGSAYTPTVTVKDGITTLTPATDYSIEYSNNINAGIAAVTITGKGNYAGSTGSSTFTIDPKVIIFAVDSITVQTYNGSAHTPVVTVRDGTTILTTTADYSLEYTDNTNAGTANVTITGAGNYTGSTGNIAFTINPKVIIFAVDSIATQTYNGSAHTPTVTVRDNTTILTLTTDYTAAYTNNTNAGTAVVTITGMGNYVGSSGNTTFTINKAAGAIVNAPTLNTKTHNSITINAVTTPSTGQSIEYGISTSNNANTAVWQNLPTFSSLNVGTTYSIFARTVGNNNYETGTVNGSLTVTTLQTISPNRFEYYWVDQHDNLVTTSGGATSIALGETLTITAQGDGYIVWQWYLDGLNTGQSGNTYNFSSTTAGKHIVSLSVEKDGKLYNTNITITVR